MPELPEVEVVRRGLSDHLPGRVIESVSVTHPRSVRRHLAGAADLAAQLAGLQVAGVHRRGKYLWLTFDQQGSGPVDTALVVHLGMSGQMLVRSVDAPIEKHAHIRATLDNGRQLRFVDQRTFGGWVLADLVEVSGIEIPEPVAHIARDPLDERFDVEAVVDTLVAKRTEIKRVLLDQSVVSGIGNIYADEALWRSRIHGTRITATLTRSSLRSLLAQVSAVLTDALASGGTSFDALYVDVNGDSGYFERGLAVYGRGDRACPRCGVAIVREKFTNRSSYSCPRCQRKGRPRVR